MESHEERIQEIIERNKEIEATEERKRRAKEIARKEHERKHGFMSSNGDYDGANRFMGSKDPNVTNAINSYYSMLLPQHNSLIYKVPMPLLLRWPQWPPQWLRLSVRDILLLAV